MDCIKLFLQANADIYQRTKLTETELLKLFSLCFDATHFQFNNKFYKQVTGTPMGSPASVVIAEIVMQKIEEQIMPLIQNFSLFWYRYVDDVITCMDKDEIQNALSAINSINSNIQFTIEMEQNACLNFLDLKINGDAMGNLSFGVYRKPTHTDRYLNYNSSHPLEHKNSVIRSLIHRADKLCDNDTKKDEFKHIKNVLQINQYPLKQINKVSQATLNQRNNSQVPPPNANLKYIPVPYVHGVSERLGRMFKKFDRKIVHKPTNTIKNQLCHLKDRRKNVDKAGVVYQLDCTQCTAKYIGETGRQAKDRMKEHQKDISNCKPASKIFQHVNNNPSHSFDFDNLRVLANEKNLHVRRHLEGVHSHMQPSSINLYIPVKNSYQQFLPQS